MQETSVHSVTLNRELCKGCINCIKRCPTEAIRVRSGKASINNKFCIDCGECIRGGPHHAKLATYDKLDVMKKYRYTVALPAPSLYSQFNNLDDVNIVLNGLILMGFDDVFDTSWGADLTILEEGTEFLERFRAVLSGGVATLPMMTSCSPGWIQFIEHNYPEHLENLSTCKSPHQMFGAVVKSYYAKKLGKKPEDMYVVSIMPCTAKKTECARPEMQNDGVPNVDAVLTTRELGDMIKAMGINFLGLPEEKFDDPLGFSTGAADIFGVTGGVMEAALRTVYEIITGRELPFPNLHVSPIVGLEEIREATIKLENVKPEWRAAEGFEVKIAVTSGFAGARKLMEQIKEGTSPYHFIEVMGCPGGCITGGGQPRPQEDINIVRQKRMEAIYGEDERKVVRKSHENKSLMDFYKEWGEPGCHASHEYLHTHYVKRGKYNELTEETFVVNK